MAVAESPTRGPGLALLIDTNVLLDVVLERQPWVEDATALLDAVAKGQAVGYVASHAIPTVYYTERLPQPPQVISSNS